VRRKCRRRDAYRQVETVRVVARAGTKHDQPTGWIGVVPDGHLQAPSVVVRTVSNRCNASVAFVLDDDAAIDALGELTGHRRNAGRTRLRQRFGKLD
jgi:hypothetical protein